MESFWEYAKIALIVGAALGLIVLILLILPGSRLRKAFSTLFFAIAGLLGIYVVSPMDFIPDIIPLLGQSDFNLACHIPPSACASIYTATFRTSCLNRERIPIHVYPNYHRSQEKYLWIVSKVADVFPLTSCSHKKKQQG